MTAAGAVCPDEPRFAVKQVVIVVEQQQFSCSDGWHCCGGVQGRFLSAVLFYGYRRRNEGAPGHRTPLNAIF